jgi:hypothetical protein
MTLEEKCKIYLFKKEGYQWVVIDSCTQIIAVNLVRLLPKKSGAFFK